MTANENAQGWDRISGKYQDYAGIPTDRIHYGSTTPTENELRLLGDLLGRAVLDVGCGGGQNTIALRRAGAASVVGIDHSEGQLVFARDLAQAEGVEVTFAQGSAETLDDLGDDSFDRVFSAYCFQFIADLPAVMRAIARVLRPGGRLAFCFDHPAYALFDEQATLSRSYFERAVTWQWAFGDATPEPMTAYYHTVEDIVAAVTGAGLVLDQILEPYVADRRVGNWTENEAVAGRVPRTIIVAAHR